MTMIDLKHPNAATDDSSLELIMEVARAIGGQDFEVEKWERMLQAYREAGPRYVMTQVAGEKIFGIMCQLQTDLQHLFGCTFEEPAAEVETELLTAKG